MSDEPDIYDLVREFRDKMPEQQVSSDDAVERAREIVKNWLNGYRYLARFNENGECANDLIKPSLLLYPHALSSQRETIRRSDENGINSNR